jgi:hypothetical protein
MKIVGMSKACTRHNGGHTEVSFHCFKLPYSNRVAINLLDLQTDADINDYKITAKKSFSNINARASR